MATLRHLRNGLIASATLTTLILVLQFRKTPTEPRAPAKLMQALNDLALADRSMQRDLLNARIGRTPNYDRLTEGTLSAEREAAALIELSHTRSALRGDALELKRLVRRQEALVARFKTDNALLQNALARFALTMEAEGTRGGAFIGLSARMLKLTLYTSAENARAAERQLRRAIAAGGAPSSTRLEIISQARLLIELLPQVDDLLTKIRDLSLEDRIVEMQKLVADAEQRDLATRRALLVALAASSLLMIALAITLLTGMRIRARELRREAASQRLSATVLNLLSDAEPRSLKDKMELALQQLAQHVGASRSFLVVDGSHPRSCTWSEARELDVDWPERAIAAAKDQDWRRDLLEPAEASAAGLEYAQIRTGENRIFLVRTTKVAVALAGFVGTWSETELRADKIAGVSAGVAAILQALARQALESEQLRLERSLARSRRMEMVGAMASGIAHNFNNILATIAGFAELATTRTRSGSFLRGHLQEIELAVDRGRQLADEILDFGRRGPLREIFLVSRLLQETERLLEASLPDGVRLWLDNDIPGALLSGSAGQLQQAVMNVCNNAAGAMPQGGPIRILVDERRCDSALELSHGTVEAGRYLVISIMDQGRGMTLEQRRRIFEPFFSTRPSGTGLGMSTAWEIVQDHAGTIDVFSELGSGARLSLWLPLFDAEGRLPPEQQLSSLLGRGERVLILAEEGDLIDLEDRIAALGYEPIGVVGWPEDLASFSSHHVASVEAVLLVAPPSKTLAVARALVETTSPLVPVLTSAPHAVEPRGSIRVLAWPLNDVDLAVALRLSVAHGQCGERTSAVAIKCSEGDALGIT